MKILLTGSSGFLGEFVFKYFSASQEIQTLGRNSFSDFQVDISQKFELKLSFDCVIHAAGKAHIVPDSEEDVRDFWDVNVIGTRNLLKALEFDPPKRFVFISSVAVYGVNSGVLLNEQSPVLARDPYGQSKIQAEAEVIQWCNYHGVICTILRLPLVYGENPPGNLKAMLKGIKNRYYFNISGGQARKSIVRAEDVARFILPASCVGGIYHLTDGMHPNFHDLSHFMAKSPGRKWIPNMPFGLARLLAKIGDFVGPSFPLNSDKLQKITSELTFDDSLARSKFGWDPQPIIPPSPAI